MSNSQIKPDFIIESSWEVCNKVGGIYTVLSTRANTLQHDMTDRVLFIGPDFWVGRENPLFKESKQLMAPWRKQAAAEGLKVRVGRWNIPGEPIVVLVDFNPFFEHKNEIYGNLWRDYGVDSLHAYGDYDEASMFSFAAAKVLESLYNHSLGKKYKNIVYQAHEWMTCLGALYIQKYIPEIATIFTTHATTIGRSIAGNNKPLYDYLFAYNGCQMADELNVQSKHSIERQTAHHVDCFTTVSEVTGRECAELLDKPADVILPNGFENSFVPKAAQFKKVRHQARECVKRVANALMGVEISDDALIIATSGRYEFKNKGIDVFLEALNRSLRNIHLDREVLALVDVPGWVACPRADLQDRLASGLTFNTPLEHPINTHWLHDMSNDHVIDMLKQFNMLNRPEDKVKVLFAPCYLDGRDGIFNMPYYDLLAGNDLCVYPSYYEPWGYTPLESVAFHVPCITTILSGFGCWSNEVKGDQSTLQDGVLVIPRNDYNYSEVADGIKDAIEQYSKMTEEEVDGCRNAAHKLSQKALWKHFITEYYKAYDFALRKRNERAHK